ncbi:MAG: TonB-dependent receptor, partial [Saprospiraceae bacterium]|nr:TonB-dependent receptor [Saprospiraceae bacterium]
ALGIHSKPEHPVFYFVENTSADDIRTLPNKNLDYIKSLHAVIGYDYRLGLDLRFKAEIYYQHLYDVAVDDDPETKGTILNTLDVWDILGDPSNVSAVGLGNNYGLDITLEKNFSRSYYFLLSGSLFRSQFRAMDNHWYSTRFDSQYQMNLLAGKEFVTGKNKNRLLGFNGKVILNGGNRTTPIDLEASQNENRTVRDLDNFLGTSIGQYYRFDVGISYKINRKKMTHTIMLDIQNVTNRLNPLEEYYNRNTQQIEQDVHTGLFPVLNYRVEF